MPFSPGSSNHRRASFSGALLSLIALLAAGCAGTSAQKREFVWPEAPETPRIKHLRAFRVPDDISTSFWRRFARVLIPSDPRAGLRSPNCMALSPDEKILYVANPAAGTLVRVDRASGAMNVIGDGGRARLVKPFGVGVDANGNVYVSDQANGEIVVLDGDGEFLRRFGQGKLESPISLAVDPTRQVLYVLNGVSSQKTDHRVEAFSLKGEHLRTIGHRGFGQGEFNFASHLAVAKDGRLFVSDMLNFRVQVFDTEGKFLTTFGAIGAGGPGFFDKSKGIAFDSFGNIYVADALHGVQIFNPTFQPLMSFAEGFIQMPTGLAIDSSNHIFVSDPPSSLVHEFVLINTTAEDSYPRPDAPSKGAPAVESPREAPVKAPTGG
jgi:sugar lactone lactonase YvrE